MQGGRQRKKMKKRKICVIRKPRNQPRSYCPSRSARSDPDHSKAKGSATLLCGSNVPRSTASARPRSDTSGRPASRWVVADLSPMGPRSGATALRGGRPSPELRCIVAPLKARHPVDPPPGRSLPRRPQRPGSLPAVRTGEEVLFNYRCPSTADLSITDALVGLIDGARRPNRSSWRALASPAGTPRHRRRTAYSRGVSVKVVLDSGDGQKAKKNGAVDAAYAKLAGSSEPRATPSRVSVVLITQAGQHQPQFRRLLVPAVR